MSKADQQQLEKGAYYGLSRKLLSREDLVHRERLEQALALDASERRRVQKDFQAFTDSFNSD